MGRARRNAPPAHCTVIAHSSHCKVARLATLHYELCVITCTRASGALYTRQRLDGNFRFLRKAENAMAFQRVPNTIEVQTVFMQFGQRVENVYHVEVPGGIDAAVLVDTTDTVATWVVETLLGNLANSLTFVACEGRNLDIEDGSVHASTIPAAQTGGASVGGEANNVSFCVSLRTARSGRSFRGRKYVCGIPTGQRTGDTLVSGYVTALLAAFNELIALLVSVDKFLVIVNRIADHVVLSEAVVTHVVNAQAVDPVLDSQRRRLTGRGT